MPTERKVRRYGRVPQHPDLRDLHLKIEAVTSLPSSVDLSTVADMPPISTRAISAAAPTTPKAVPLTRTNTRSGEPSECPAWVEGLMTSRSGAGSSLGLSAGRTVCRSLRRPMKKTFAPLN